MNFDRAEELLWYLNIAATVLLLVRLFSQDLWRSYPFLTSYLFCDALQQLLGVAVRLILAQAGRAYATVYTVGQAVKLVVAVLVVVELYGHALSSYPAIRKFGQRLVWQVLVVASVISLVQLALAPPDTRGAPAFFMQNLRSYERTVDLALLLLLLAAIGFVGWFPVRVARNFAFYLGGFTAYFLLRWSGLLILNAYPQSRSTVSLASLGFSLAATLGMALAMRRGDSETVAPGHRWNAAEMDRLARQLDTINSNLARQPRGG